MATYNGDQREQLCEWLRANGANPDEVPLNSDMTISTDDDGIHWLHYEQYATINGGRYMNPWGTDAAVDKHKVRLVAEPPDWWEPQIQPTRDALIHSRDHAYYERDYALAWLAAHQPAVISPANDMDDRARHLPFQEPGWHALVVTINGTAIRFNIAPNSVDLFTHVEHVEMNDPRAQPGGRGVAPERVADHRWRGDLPMPMPRQPTT